jgi:YYY domain-containing protein
MLSFFAWYVFVTFLGWLTFPLTYRLFPALADRGYGLARALGMLVWGYVFWMLVSLGILQNNAGGLLLALLTLTAVSGFGLLQKERRAEFVEWIRSNRRTIVTVEICFFLAFAAWAFVRASDPNIETAGGEKTMELAFINAIMRSPTFPPHDPWLSGYAISYYYFGYVMAAMLAEVTGTLGSVAHNLMTSLVFALSFIGAYSILYNLLAAWRLRQPDHRKDTPRASTSSFLLGLPLLGPLFLLLVSNFEAFLDVLHSKGLFWQFNPAGQATTSSFWSWLGILELSDAPTHLSFVPERFNWLWRASRVVQDLDLLKGSTEIIDEFPAFSYMLGDLHPHVLAMPFDILAIGVAINLFLGGWKGETDLRFYKLPVRLAGVFFAGLILGGLAFLNTWDILLGFALVAGAFGLARALEHGWTWKRLEEIIAFCVPVGLLAILLYLPFYVGFSSQAGGILPNLVSPTRGAHLWVMFGPLFLAMLAYLVYLWRSEKRPANWKLGLGLGLGLSIFLWLASWLLAYLAFVAQPGFVKNLIDTQCSGSVLVCFKDSTLRRLSYSGGFLTLFSLLGTTLAMVLPGRRREPEAERASSDTQDPIPFVLLLILLGTLLVLAPDYVFLRDLFTSRLNTVFKFYYQAWLMWSLASAFGVAVLLQKLRGIWGWIFRTGLVVVVAMALFYPVLGLPVRTNDFQIPSFLANLDAARKAGNPKAFVVAAQVWTLDGSIRIRQQYPDDAAAAQWLLTAPEGVVAEAASMNAYSEYGRMAVYSGQPTVIGWWWHEFQWRGTTTEMASPLPDLNCQADYTISLISGRQRGDDIACLYTTSSWDVASQIIGAYHIRYVVIGSLEHMSYRINDLKFQQHLIQVFKQNDVVIYEVP